MEASRTFANLIPVDLPADMTPRLLAVVDTEEEFEWGKAFSRESVGTDTLSYQNIGQDILDRYGLKPTYVVDYPVATSPAVWSLRKIKDSGRCQIGAHLHPWVSPPFEEDVGPFNSFPGNLPRELEFRKLEFLTDVITKAAGEPPRVYKAGRYGIGPNTAEALAKLGYKVDVSLVPHSDFRADCGPDFRGLRDRPFWFGPQSSLLEIPGSCGFVGSVQRYGPEFDRLLRWPFMRRFRMTGVAARLRLLERVSLSPEGFTLDEQCRLLRAMVEAGHRVFTLTYHSPSLVPGHTPYVRSRSDLEVFLSKLDGVIRFFMEELNGMPTTHYEMLRLVENIGAPVEKTAVLQKR